MKIALAQINTHIGNISSNVSSIIQNIERAKRDGAGLIVFPELCVSGYPPLDLLEFDEFIDSCEKAVLQIAECCIGIAAIVGAPSRNFSQEGKNLFNSAYFLEEGKIKQVVHKTLLPNYDVFDEYRYFESNNEFNCIDFQGKKIALTICEDLWDVEEDKLYVRWPFYALYGRIKCA